MERENLALYGWLWNSGGSEKQDGIDGEEGNNATQANLGC